jgi:hypothetical protein
VNCNEYICIQTWPYVSSICHLSVQTTIPCGEDFPTHVSQDFQDQDTSKDWPFIYSEYWSRSRRMVCGHKRAMFFLPSKSQGHVWVSVKINLYSGCSLPSKEHKTVQEIASWLHHSVVSRQSFIGRCIDWYHDSDTSRSDPAACRIADSRMACALRCARCWWSGNALVQLLKPFPKSDTVAVTSNLSTHAWSIKCR